MKQPEDKATQGWVEDPLLVTFGEWDCVVQFSEYGNGRTAIRLVHAVDGDPIAVATVNLPDEPMGDDMVAIKDYSENEGMLEVLRQAGVISNPVRWVESGYVSIPLCMLKRRG